MTELKGSLKNRMTALWEEVLGAEKVEGSDNIMEIGGTSILIYKICMLASERWGLTISPIDIMMYPSVDALTDHIEQKPGAAAQERVKAARPARRRNLRSANQKG